LDGFHTVEYTPHCAQQSTESPQALAQASARKIPRRDFLWVVNSGAKHQKYHLFAGIVSMLACPTDGLLLGHYMEN
jgi:hypothetical protein